MNSGIYKKYNLDQGHIGKILNNQRKSHKGWTKGE